MKRMRQVPLCVFYCDDCSFTVRPRNLFVAARISLLCVLNLSRRKIFVLCTRACGSAFVWYTSCGIIDFVYSVNKSTVCILNVGLRDAKCTK